MATRVIDLDPEFDEPTSRVVDVTMERASVDKASADEVSTSGAVALMVGGGFLPVGLSPESLRSFTSEGVGHYCGRRYNPDSGQDYARVQGGQG
ncbi:hypothetical protein ACOSP7_002808 [Xanthoceras sorbifolium]